MLLTERSDLHMLTRFKVAADEQRPGEDMGRSCPTPGGFAITGLDPIWRFDL